MNDEDSKSGPSRRTLLQGGAAAATMAVVGGGSFLTSIADAAAQANGGISVSVYKGPYQNNGATPWYGYVPIGSPGQYMKIALDTGSNFIWTTSTLCGSSGCQHYGNSQFNYATSNSFNWISTTPKDVSFGPWGTMTVWTGKDLLSPGNQTAPAAFYLAQSYTGSQFAQLDWDGGIGFPSGSPYVDPSTSFFYGNLMNAGKVDPQMPYVSFYSDQASGTGQVLIGGYDTSKFDQTSGIFMPWTPYTQFPDVEYIWTTPLASMWVGGTVVTRNTQFCLDSGSSQFKGDDNIMNTILYQIAQQGNPNIDIYVGTDSLGNTGHIRIGPSTYNVKIEAGPDQGKTLPQFNPLGLNGLVLVGSVLMDLFYTIYVYNVSGSPGNYQLTPYGMWLFNKRNGPKLIQKSKQAAKGSRAGKLGPRKVAAAAAPAAAKEYGPGRGAHRGGK